MSQRSGTWAGVGSQSLGVISQGCPCFLRASQLVDLKENHPGFSVTVRGCTSLGRHSRCSLSKGTKSEGYKVLLWAMISEIRERKYTRTIKLGNSKTQLLLSAALWKSVYVFIPFYIRRKVCLLLSLLSYIFNHLKGFHSKILHAHNTFSFHLAGRLVPASRRWPLLCITSSLR